MHLVHSTVVLCDGMPELNAMEVAIPTAPSEWAAGELAQRLRADAQATFALTTKRPKWNSRSDSYELPFNGRANFASERNFQLISREGGMGERDRQGLPKTKVLLLHGKLEETPSDVFALDFTFPFSPLHAFLIVASTWAW